jgi:hypothetical protein
MGNPVILKDPDGRDIDPDSEKNSKIQNRLNPNHASYNKGFADIYRKLKNDHNAVYSFNEVDLKRTSSGRLELGEVVYNGTNDKGQYEIGINYATDPGASGLSIESSLLEETYHAGQFSDGKLGYAVTRDGVLGIALPIVSREICIQSTTCTLSTLSCSAGI